jgi:hypothetical protein
VFIILRDFDGKRRSFAVRNEHSPRPKNCASLITLTPI